ncbi:YihY/virulence factor BrkB family protein [Haloarcula pelagica]|uniref:YihY/virulence factor BrkB family protein n=1 Tax=Haloarcula pelagica TaxID=3033389 RepID=UPI0024C29A57|nr:YihY/virulence factor BrkB family protein [Halomicroarcula sp. YJ-61-S]
MTRVSSQVSTAVSVGRLCLRVFRERDMMYHAAAISYYTLVSLVPLLTLLLFVTTVLHEEAVATMITAFVGTYLLPANEEILLEQLVGLARAGHHTVIGLAVAVWGAFRTVTGIKRSFAGLYEPASRGVVKRVRETVLTFFTVGFALFAAAGTAAVIGFLDHPGSVFGPLVLGFTLVIVFFPIYYFLPDADLSASEVLPGAVLAATGWSVLSTLFGSYIGFTGGSGAGVVGSVLLLLTWFYIAGILLLFGCVLNAVLVGHV